MSIRCTLFCNNNLHFCINILSKCKSHSYSLIIPFKGRVQYGRPFLQKRNDFCTSATTILRATLYRRHLHMLTTHINGYRMLLNSSRKCLIYLCRPNDLSYVGKFRMKGKPNQVVASCPIKRPTHWTKSLQKIF